MEIYFMDIAEGAKHLTACDIFEDTDLLTLQRGRTEP